MRVDNLEQSRPIKRSVCKYVIGKHNLFLDWDFPECLKLDRGCIQFNITYKHAEKKVIVITRMIEISRLSPS